MVVEGTLAAQQPAPMAHSNAMSELNGGWPSFEANDGSTGTCTIAADKNGDIALELSCEPTSAVTNRLTVEFQDPENDYLNGSLSLVDLDDIARAGSEVAGIFRGVGLPSLTQAQRVLSKELAKGIDGNLYAQFTTTVMGLGMQPGDLIAITSADYALTRAPFRVLRLSPGLNYETVTVLAQAHDDGWYAPGGAISSTATGWPSAAGAGAPFPIAGTSYDPVNGYAFTITETSEAQSDGGANELLNVQFHPPRTQVAALAAPAISAQAAITTGAIAPGGATLYYAVTAVDANGLESTVSQIVQIATGALTTPYGVTLNGLTAPAGAAGMRVYRGTAYYDLLYLADIAASATTWTDAGGAVAAMRPPDPRYDHADFYWRTELTAQLAIVNISGQTLSFADQGYAANQFAGSLARIVSGAANAWQGTVVANTSSTITVLEPLPVLLTEGDQFVAIDASWRYAGCTNTDQLTWEIPNRAGLMLEIVGLSSTADGVETPIGQSFVARYLVIGGAGLLTDSRIPPQPNYTVVAPGDGTLTVEQISVPTLTGTTTVDAAMLAAYSVDETTTPTTFTLNAGMGATDVTMQASAGTTLAQGTYLQIDGEILCTANAGGANNGYAVNRAVGGSAAAAHAAGATATVLTTKLLVVALGPGFFLNPAHTNFQASLVFPNQRIAATGLYLKNTMGTGPAQSTCYLANGADGLHTYSGGTIVMQTSGVLSIETDAGGALSLDRPRVVRDVQAYVDVAPSGGAISVVVNAAGVAVATLTIADGATQAAAYVPASPLMLAEGTRLSFDIVSVPLSANTYPGKSLTVQVRT
jgi:hypothetical protein